MHVTQKISPFLWFDDQAEGAARFYTGIFKDAALGDIHRYTEAGPGKAGTVMLVEFELNGQRFTGLNGGPQPFGFNEAVSFCVTCADQAEVDYYWDALLEGGGEPSVCGWLKDRYGVRWQVVPEVFTTRTSPASRNLGRKLNELETSERSCSVATSMRTASRVRPRASGGSDASSSGGRS